VCDDGSDGDDDEEEDDEYASCPRLSLAPSHSRTLAFSARRGFCSPTRPTTHTHTHTHTRARISATAAALSCPG
jgi:hypothetical protein